MVVEVVGEEGVAASQHRQQVSVVGHGGPGSEGTGGPHFPHLVAWYPFWSLLR